MSGSIFKCFDDITTSDNDPPPAAHSDIDLVEHLANSWSLSTPEERLAQQLNQTHIAAPATLSIFALPPSHFQQQAQHSAETRSKFPTFSAPPQTVNNNNNIWNAVSADWNTTTTTIENKDDGWGEGPPSYTSISQGTYFGFNSIMEAPSKLNTTTAENTRTTQAQAQAFSQYKNTPVTFTSAVAEAQPQTQAAAHYPQAQHK